MVSFFKYSRFKQENTRTLLKAAVVAGTVICLLITGLFWLSTLLTRFLGLPPSLELQPVSRIGGWAILLAGAALALWLFRYRSPTSMIVSTYFTFGKMFTKSPISTLGGRTEPLVVDGPQRYVRHPLYLAATIAFLGWAIVTGSTSFFIGVIFILLWFAFVQIPFEEKELRAIFGTQYVQYSKRVPMLIPFTKHPHQEE